MASLNRVTLIGNLTRDPELRYTPSGTAMTKFGIAMNEKYKKGDEWVEKTTFVDIVVWARQAETCSEYLSKGRSVCVDGKLSFSQWETDDGQKRSKLEVVANNVVFLGGGKSDGAGGGGGSKSSDYSDGPSDDDVPF